MRFIAGDTETFGLNPETSSLLTAYFAILDENLNAVDEIYLQIKPNKDENYIGQVSALKVNKIDLVEHDKKAITRTESVALLSDFLFRNTNMRQEKLTPIFHNGNFDLSFIFKHLMPKDAWEQYVSYRVIDTASIAHFLKLKKAIPENTSSSLEGLCKHFDINIANNHNAKIDTVAMVKLLEKFLTL